MDKTTSHSTEPDKALSLPQKNPVYRILVVDDEPDIRGLNAEVLIRAGYKVATAEDGLAGWEALHASRHAPGSFDFLITDFDMPGMTGLALIKKLRDAHMILPVIMATGKLPQEDLFTRYPWLQPAVMLMKPYSSEQLLGTVKAALRINATPINQLLGSDRL